MQETFVQICNILNSKLLPSHDELFAQAEKICSLLENESGEYRVLSSGGKSGSLLDFSKSDILTIVVPDLHARPKFLANILKFKLSGEYIGIENEGISVFEALEKHLVRVICVGDALHSECETRERWQSISEEFEHNDFTGESMMEEMSDGLSLVLGLLKLKQLFPEHFHFLKGNHENILNKNGDGDCAFRKFADEGYMVKSFMAEYYGEDVLYMLACIETVLPLVAITKNCVISHAEPAKAFTLNQIVNARENPEVVYGLTWTDNGCAEENSVEKTIKNLTGKKNVDDYVFIGGHRPVCEKYSERQNGKYVQIHNPKKENIALVHTNRKFLPDYDIVSVKKQEKVDE